MTVGQIVGEGLALHQPDLSREEHQRRVLALLAELRRRRGLSYIFISHDLAVICSMTHRVMVVKDGDVVEEGETLALSGARLASRNESRHQIVFTTRLARILFRPR